MADISPLLKLMESLLKLIEALRPPVKVTLRPDGPTNPPCAIIDWRRTPLVPVLEVDAVREPRAAYAETTDVWLRFHRRFHRPVELRGLPLFGAPRNVVLQTERVTRWTVELSEVAAAVKSVGHQPVRLSAWVRVTDGRTFRSRVVQTSLSAHREGTG